MKLQRDTVIRTALDLLDEVGIDGLSTRRLAERLGVQSPALYWHFKNKRALLDAMAAAMMEEGGMRRTAEPGADWRDWLAADARQFRRALLSRRDGARLHAGTRPEPAEFAAVESETALLCTAGLAPADALRAQIAIGRYVVGWVLEEQADAADAAEREGEGEGERMAAADLAAYPRLAEGMAAVRDADPDAEFDHGLGLLLDGIAARIRR
ncbi:TetR/AcrR family transcriptional regulator C-terminal domain-containing protein [Inquilinus limosus]|uniref:TetR family transcriptional regulator n=1 Tax=Inquilinus limosus TaxID=171674 RepID=A0A211ZJV2_9PROT|nr:TetR/AcrR family transcriptional regulator C-terminal domain-containing protein [Inquilinus limosus]OWJ65529.1 TetR family transcriptional regulator [Inquilinus limosus]